MAMRTARTPGFSVLKELQHNIAELQLDRFYDGDLQVCLQITRRLIAGVKALDQVESLEAENRTLKTKLAAKLVWSLPPSTSTKRK